MKRKIVKESIFEPPSEKAVYEKIVNAIKRGFFSGLGDFQPLKVKDVSDPNDPPGGDDFLVLYKVTEAGDLIYFYTEEGDTLSDLTHNLEDELDDFESLDDEPYDIGEIKRIVDIDKENQTVILVMSLTTGVKLNKI